jgi:hypothetical protein
MPDHCGASAGNRSNAYCLIIFPHRAGNGNTTAVARWYDGSVHHDDQARGMVGWSHPYIRVPLPWEREGGRRGCAPSEASGSDALMALGESVVGHVRLTHATEQVDWRPEPSQTIAWTGLRFISCSLRTKPARLPSARLRVKRTLLTPGAAARAWAIWSQPCAGR